MANTNYRPGMVVRFTYRHFWPKDQNSRADEKEIFVLHPHWEGKVHGVDLKVLNKAKLEIFKIVMNPRNNGLEKGPGIDPQAFGVGQGSGVGQDFIDKIRNQGALAGPAEVENRIKYHLAKWEHAKEIAREMGRPFSEKWWQDENARLSYELERAKEQDGGVEEAELRKQPIPPIAADILRRMKPARLVNNPRIFYAMFIKPFLGGIDAYRTFFPGRMQSPQEIPRWQWVKGSALASTPAKGIKEKSQGARQPPKKYYGQQEQEEPDDYQRFSFGGGGQFKIDEAGGGGGGQRPMSRGVMEDTKEARRQPAVRRFDKNNTEIVQKGKVK